MVKICLIDYKSIIGEEFIPTIQFAFLIPQYHRVNCYRQRRIIYYYRAGNVYITSRRIAFRIGPHLKQYQANKSAIMHSP